MILALLSGLLLALSMPGPDLGWLAWIALIPLLWALKGKEPKQALRIGWFSGTIFFGGLLYWFYTLWDWASGFIVIGYLILIVYLGIYGGVFSVLYSLLTRWLPRWALILAVPALWAGLEFLRSLTRFGFPWGQVSDALYQQLPFVQIASLTGSWGLSFLVVMANYLFYLGMESRQWRYPLVAIALVGLTFGWGWFEMNRSLPEGRELRIRLVQSNIPQRIRSDPKRLNEFLEIHQQLLDEVAREGEGKDLVILPESFLPAFVIQDSPVREVFTEWAKTHQSALLLGTYTHQSQRVYNSAAFLSSQGEVVDTYSKVQLVPFSTEYFPGIELLDQLGFWRWIPIGRLGALTPGKSFQPLRTELGAIATPICFESIFPQISRAFVQEGAQLIVTITNDAWFKNTWALPQHFAKGVFRAVENGRYFVQAANTGISGIIDPRGRVLLQSQIETRTTLQGTVHLLESETLYTRYGDWFIYFNLAYLAMLLMVSFARSRQQAERSSPAT
jgi:apolipoprotein N-acyltransferase